MNENNQAISSYDYDAWGNPMNSTVSEECAYRYTGREYDDETGLHNFRARLYDSTLMRFYQVDPAEQFASPYVYCGNNPIGLADPDGLEAKFSGEDDVDILRRDLSKSFLAYPSTVDRRGFIHRLIGPPTGPITDEETSFWQVVDDPKVLVTLSFDNDGIGSDGQPIYGGVYEGNRNTSHWWNFSKYDYKAKHTVHRLSMQKYHEVGGCDVGSSWIFEFRESYIGVKLFPGQGYSNNNHMFSHDQAMAQCINKIEPQAGGSRLITNSELVNPGDYPLKYRRTMIDKCWWILNGKRAEWDIEHTTVGD
jgi:RHS repeat-associated protein